MKIRAKANGEVIDVSEEAATILIEAGIYDLVDASEVSTKVEPMTTKDSPLTKKRGR